jgi:hypothetical protein
VWSTFVEIKRSLPVFKWTSKKNCNQRTYYYHLGLENISLAEVIKKVFPTVIDIGGIDFILKFLK